MPAGVITKVVEIISHVHARGKTESSEDGRARGGGVHNEIGYHY